MAETPSPRTHPLLFQCVPQDPMEPDRAPKIPSFPFLDHWVVKIPDGPLLCSFPCPISTSSPNLVSEHSPQTAGAAAFLALQLLLMV